MVFGFSYGPVLPRLKFNAKTGQVFLVSGKKDEAGNWINKEEEITSQCAFMVDDSSLKQGWIDYDVTPPDRIVVSTSEPLPQKPSEQYRPFASVNIKLKGSHDGTLCEFAASSFSVIGALEKAGAGQEEENRHVTT